MKNVCDEDEKYTKVVLIPWEMMYGKYEKKWRLFCQKLEEYRKLHPGEIMIADITEHKILAVWDPNIAAVMLLLTLDTFTWVMQEDGRTIRPLAARARADFDGSNGKGSKGCFDGSNGWR